LDLLGRKVLLGGGEPLRALLSELERECVQSEAMPELAEHSVALREAVAELATTTQVLAARLTGGEPRLALANASLYLNLFGHVLIAWTWLRQARVALLASATASGSERDFYQGKIATCHYFFRYELPGVLAQAGLLQSLDDTTVSVSSDQL
jgi:butyryl-CoA dehydrogenase